MYLYYHFFSVISSAVLVLFYFLLKILFKNPSSIICPNMFLRIINAIGPIKSPIIPVILKPVYIAIKVNIGCVPVFLLTSFGSNTCLVIVTIINKPINTNDNEEFPSKKEIIVHGIITVPEPKYWQSIYKCNS